MDAGIEVDAGVGHSQLEGRRFSSRGSGTNSLNIGATASSQTRAIPNRPTVQRLCAERCGAGRLGAVPSLATLPAGFIRDATERDTESALSTGLSTSPDDSPMGLRYGGVSGVRLPVPVEYLCPK